MRHGLANSLLVEFANTPDQWRGGAAGGIIANVDAMVSATRLSDSAPGSWNDADMLQVCNYGKGRTPGGGMSLSEYRSHYAVCKGLDSSQFILATRISMTLPW